MPWTSLAQPAKPLGPPTTLLEFSHEDIFRIRGPAILSQTPHESTSNSPRIANCRAGSFGSPRDLLFGILVKAATEPSQPPITVCRTVLSSWGRAWKATITWKSNMRRISSWLCWLSSQCKGCFWREEVCGENVS